MISCYHYQRDSSWLAACAGVHQKSATTGAGAFHLPPDVDPNLDSGKESAARKLKKPARAAPSHQRECVAETSGN